MTAWVRSSLGWVGCWGIAACSNAVGPAPQTVKAPATEGPRSRVEILTCPQGPDAFASLRWIPPHVRAVALLDLTHPAFDEAMQQVTARARAPDSQLPVRVAFSLGQLHWQLPQVQLGHRRAGFRPRVVAYVLLPDGVSLWAWPPACDLDTIAHNLPIGLGLGLKSTAFGAIATPLGTRVFSDFLAWGSSIYAFVPPERGISSAAQLEPAATSARAPAIDNAIEQLPAGPIRVVIRMDDLLAPSSEPSKHPTILAAHIDGSGWHPADE